MSNTTTEDQTTQSQGQTQADILDQLLKPEVQESITILVENLPKLAEMTTVLTKSYDLIQALTSDKVLVDDLVGGMKEFVEPIEKTAKGVAQTAIEASDRAASDTTTVGLFGLLRMLKDPQMQKVFRFAQAYLDVSAKQQNQSK